MTGHHCTPGPRAVAREAHPHIPGTVGLPASSQVLALLWGIAMGRSTWRISWCLPRAGPAMAAGDHMPQHQRLKLCCQPHSWLCRSRGPGRGLDPHPLLLQGVCSCHLARVEWPTAAPMKSVPAQRHHLVLPGVKRDRTVISANQLSKGRGSGSGREIPAAVRTIRQQRVAEDAVLGCTVQAWLHRSPPRCTPNL